MAIVGKKASEIGGWWEQQVTVSFASKGARKSTVSVQHLKLKSAKQAETLKQFWGDRLALLKERLEG